MKVSVRKVAIIGGGGLGALLLGCVIFIMWNANRIKAEGFGIDNNPMTIADLVLAHIKRRGALPRTVSECLVPVESPVPGAFENYGQIWIETPEGKNVVVKSVVDRMSIDFPSTPEALTLRDDKLVWRDSGREAMLLSMRGWRNDSVLKQVNVYLWEKWRLLASGQSTGLEWLDGLKATTTSPGG